MQLCLPPDESDKRAYVVEESIRRVKMFEQEHGLDRNAPNLDERRARAAIEAIFEIPADAPDWWDRVGLTLIIKHVPGFSISSRGRPHKWRFADYVALDVGVRAMKGRRPELRGNELYEALRRREPKWADYGISALRRAHVQAKEIFRKFPMPVPAQAK